jgi:hypothetical protein
MYWRDSREHDSTLSEFREHLTYFASKLSAAPQIPAEHRADGSLLGKSWNRIIDSGEAEPVMRFGKGHVYGFA